MKIVHMACLLGVLYVTGCSVKGNTNEKQKDVELPVLELGYRDTLLHRSYVATINAFQNVELRAKVDGFLEQILVDEGQYVKKGQPLFQLNDAEFKVQLSEAAAAVASAKADVKAAEVEMNRVTTLVAKNVLSSSEKDLAKARLAAATAKEEEANAQLEKARIRLSYTMIRAPFNGIIDRIPHKLGSLIAEGTLLTTVSDIHAMHAYFNVSENEYLAYEKRLRKDPQTLNGAIQLILADGSKYPHSGKIETLDGEFDDATGSIAFRARFNNPDKLLKHGASGKVRLSNEQDNVIMIPQKSVFEIQDKNYVFLLDKNNVAHMHSFAPQTRIDQYYIMQSGLEAGDVIVYEGVQNLRDGARIKPVYTSADSLIAKN